MSTDGALPRLSRYEALFELSSEINASVAIGQVGDILARGLKYVADVHSWRYFSVEPEHASAGPGQRIAIAVDGHRGKATVQHIPFDQLCYVELGLWEKKKAGFLEGDELADAKKTLPEQFRRDEIVQLYVCPRFGGEDLQSILLYSKLRQSFNELDVKFLTLASQFFHEKVYVLWEQEKLRELERAYLQQELVLRQSEKLATLGKLSAGMAHELNNPAAAAQRGAEQLRVAVERLRRSHRSLGEIGWTATEREVLENLLARAAEVDGPAPELDPLARSDMEDALERWLESHGVDEPWELAPTLTDLGLTGDTLDEALRGLTAGQLTGALTALVAVHGTRSLLEEVREGASRVAEIVKALKSYTYLDQAPLQAVNLREGLESTLVILRNKLKQGVTVHRKYDETLPQVQAFGTELNQVWTNIIDNAIGAMNGQGTLTLKTYVDGPWAVVEIIDDGPGIPPDIAASVFDPFFTTKAPGEGTGLGLNISHNIVAQKHFGSIEVRSKPGRTSFFVRVPLDREAAEKRQSRPSMPEGREEITDVRSSHTDG